MLPRNSSAPLGPAVTTWLTAVSGSLEISKYMPFRLKKLLLLKDQQLSKLRRYFDTFYFWDFDILYYFSEEICCSVSSGRKSTWNFCPREFATTEIIRCQVLPRIAKIAKLAMLLAYLLDTHLLPIAAESTWATGFAYLHPPDYSAAGVIVCASPSHLHLFFIAQNFIPSSMLLNLDEKWISGIEVPNIYASVRRQKSDRERR